MKRRDSSARDRDGTGRGEERQQGTGAEIARRAETGRERGGVGEEVAGRGEKEEHGTLDGKGGA